MTYLGKTVIDIGDISSGAPVDTSIAIPGGIAINDQMILAVCVYATSSNDPVVTQSGGVTPLVGWSTIAQSSGAGITVDRVGIALLKKKYAGESSPIAFRVRQSTVSGVMVKCFAVLVVYSGLSVGPSVESNGVGGGAGTATTGDIVLSAQAHGVGANPQTLVTFWGLIRNASGTPTFTPPTLGTDRGMDSHSSAPGPTACYMNITDEPWDSASDYPVRTANYSWSGASKWSGLGIRCINDAADAAVAGGSDAWGWL